MGDESRVADYFVVAGLPDEPEPLADSIDKPHLKSSLRYAAYFRQEVENTTQLPSVRGTKNLVGRRC